MANTLTVYVCLCWLWSMTARGEVEPDEYTNKWVAEVRGGEEVAQRVARGLGFTYKGQAGPFIHHYVLIRDDHPRVSLRDSSHLTRDLLEMDEVKWAKQMVLSKWSHHGLEPGSQVETRGDDVSCAYDPVTKQTSCWSKMWSYLFGGWQTNTGLLGTFSTKPSDIDQLTTYKGPTQNVNLQSKKLSAYASKFKDPLWKYQWYVQDYRVKDMPVMDHNVVPVYDMGITGKGVLVAVVDGGVEGHHPDLQDNFLGSVCYNPCKEKNDCTPEDFGDEKANSHGTNCAGVIAMVANNPYCGVGIAYNAKVTGISALCLEATELEKSKALTYEKDTIDIYVNSWGTSGEATQMRPIEHMVNNAFHTGITEGRKKKGSIYLFSAGNGKRLGDNCASSSWVNHVATIVIAGASQYGKVTPYSSRCTAIYATAYSSGKTKDEKVVAPKIGGGCTTDFTGTSAATPLAGGIIALVLEANKHLTYRDVMHLISLTAEVAPLANNKNSWYKNAKGFWVSNDFGFGLLNAENMVTMAKDWRKVPEKHTCEVMWEPDGKSYEFDVQSPPATITIDTTACQEKSNAVYFLEQLELTSTIDCSYRGAISMTITSPSKTTSVLLETRIDDFIRKGLENWNIKSVHNWGENPNGKWIVQVSANVLSGVPGSYGTVRDLKLTFHGTANPPHNKKRKYAAFRLPNGKTNA